MFGADIAVAPFVLRPLVRMWAAYAVSDGYASPNELPCPYSPNLVERGVLRSSYPTSRITLSRWVRSGLVIAAKAGGPSQYMGSVHKDLPCRMPRVLTPPRPQY